MLVLGTSRRGTNSHCYFLVSISLANSKHEGKWPAVVILVTVAHFLWGTN